MFSTLRTLTKKLLGLTFLFSLSFSPLSVSAGPYLDSAHGNTGYGVERTALASSHTQGNCGHCHDQHTAAADGYLLLTDNFSDVTTNPYSTSDPACFACHSNVDQLQTGITNNNYSATFGGAAATTTSIRAAFNQTSYHNLYDIKEFITDTTVTKPFDDFPTESNPCSGCHNAHIAKANKRSPGNPSSTAISRPSDHNNLWGDDTTERMTSAAYGTSYQPPYYSGSSSLLEPDGLSSDKATQAAKTPDYITFCTDCHNATNVIWSTKSSRNLKTFDWDLEQHGAGAATDSTKVEMIAPYSDANLGSFILSCLDCHEPHGSNNSYLLRTSVNASPVDLPAGTEDDAQEWDHLCSSCHLAASDLRNFHHLVSGDFDCLDCHYTKPPTVPLVRNCITCHYHGSAAGLHKTF